MVACIDVKMDGSALEWKIVIYNSWASFPYKLGYCFYIASVAKSASLEIGAFTPSMKVLSSFF